MKSEVSRGESKPCEPDFANAHDMDVGCMSYRGLTMGADGAPVKADDVELYAKEWSTRGMRGVAELSEEEVWKVGRRFALDTR